MFYIFPILYSMLNKLYIFSNGHSACYQNVSHKCDTCSWASQIHFVGYERYTISWNKIHANIMAYVLYGDSKIKLVENTSCHEGSLNTVSMECECTCAFDALLSLPKGPINLASSVRESTIAKVKWQWEKGKGNRS